MARIDLTGRPIAITGGSSGIGEATAVECARAGMPVAIGARRVHRLREVADRIRAGGGSAVEVEMDVNNPEDCERLVEATVGEFGSIYAVYANAGYGLEKAVHETTNDQFRAIFETNFFGSLNVVRPALERMRGAGEGHVLLCSSCLAKMTIPYYSAYSATKAAQSHVGRAMRLELEPEGIHVSVVHPIGTRTEFFNNVKQQNGGKPLVQHTPERFVQSAERVARATVRALRRPRPEVWTSLFVRFGMSMCTMFPALADLGTRKMVRERLEKQKAHG